MYLDSDGETMNSWIVFISHASEDKEEFVRQLAEALDERGLSVWYDEFSLRLGDSLRRSIDKGLSSCDYGVVVLSPAFFAKEWPQRELDALFQRDTIDQKVILPVWHNISRDEVAQHSPLLADRVAVKSSDGLERVVGKILEIVSPERSKMAVQQMDESGPPPRPDELLTRDSLLRYARAKSGETDWQPYILNVYQVARILNIVNIAQFSEAVDDVAARESLTDIYERLLHREADWVGILVHQPWVFLQGARGRELVEQSVLSSPEYRTKHDSVANSCGNLNERT
jgi:TIR domain